MFPKTNKCLRGDIARSGLTTRPLTRNQPEPDAVFGKPGPPVLARMGVWHI